MRDDLMLEEVNLADLEILEEALAPSCAGWACGANGGGCEGSYCG